MPADASASSSDFFLQLEPGTKLAGCYLLKQRIEGATPPVWNAHDEVLAKEIALQFVPASVLARPGAIDQLRQEVKRARQFVNPRALRVHDLVEEGDWTAVVLDPMGGRPLRAAMAENTHAFFEAAEVLPVARELCEVLDAAHQIRLVHGGLSPDVVLVGGGQAKVMGFGYGTLLREGEASPYASAQQLGGASATAADDVFAVGALLHTLLAGAVPFEGAKRTGAPTVSEHRRALKHRGGEVPEAWERTIASCLADDPAARPASSGEILRAIESSVSVAPAPSAAASAPVEKPSEPAVAAAPVVVSEPPAQPAPEPLPVEAAKAEPQAEQTTPEPSAPETKAESTPESKAEAEEEPKPEPEPKRSSSRKSAATIVDPNEVAAQVRREEAEEEARGLSPVQDEEAFYERPHGSGPSLLTLAIVVIFVAIVGFICYQVFFANSSRSASDATASTELATTIPTPQPTPMPSTPEPTPAMKAASATPTPATPEPEPAMKLATATPMAASATPEPLPIKSLPTPTVSLPPAPVPAGDAPKPTAVAEAPKQIESAIAEMKLAREKTRKELPPAKRAADDLDKQQKKLEDDLKKAEAAAQEAGRIAEEKLKLADDVRKTAATAAEKAAAKKSELTKAEELLAKLEVDLKERESALAQAKVAAEAAKASQALASERMPKTSATPAPATPAPSTPKPASAPVSDDPRVAFEQKMKELSKALDGDSKAKAATPPPDAAKPAMELAKATTPAPERAPSSQSGLINSLGMRMLPLPGEEVMVCIWPTRVRDFEVFAKAAGLKSNLWKDPGFRQTGDHPVVNVSWQEAVAFCKWLTAKEQREGVISTKQSYRLPSDLEWSRAAGLTNETGTTPEARDMGVADLYPWGKTWPPPVGAGNYTGEETGSEVAIKGYNDGFPWTSPVGSFPANKLGFYDMGGNVWQWCMDSWNAESKAKVLRGASWYNGALKLSLLTSCRVHASPDSSTDNYGFRVALANGE